MHASEILMIYVDSLIMISLEKLTTVILHIIEG